MIEERDFLIARLDGLTGHEKLLVHQTLADASFLDQVDEGWFSTLAGRKLGTLRPQAGKRLSLARSDMEAWAKGIFHVRCFVEDDYPALLKRIWDPPWLLWYRGCEPPGDARLVSVVGTRHPGESARRAAWILGREAALMGRGLVSGLAYGIDGAAHAGCVDASGYTLAVLAGGIDLVVPHGHRQLAARLLDAGGALMSEFPPGTGVQKWLFPRRNRLISGLSPELVVVQAPRHSGALTSAAMSLEEGRDVFVHVTGLESPLGDGTRELAAQGAGVIRSLVELERL